MTGKAKGKSAKIESVSVKPGNKKLAETVIEGFFRELRGDITAMLPYIDETTFGYLGKIRDAKSFKILTSNIFPSKAKIDRVVRGLGRPVEIWEITSPRKSGAPVRLLHERWVSDGRIFVDIGTDLKWRALGHTQHTIRRDSAKGHMTELDTFNEHWKNVLAGRAKESFGGPINLQHVVCPEKPSPAAEIPTKPAIPKKAEFARRPERREKRMEVRVPSPAPQAGRPKREKVVIWACNEEAEKGVSIARRVAEEKRIDALFVKRGIKCYYYTGFEEAEEINEINAIVRGWFGTTRDKLGRLRYIGIVDYCPDHPLEENLLNGHRIKPRAKTFKQEYDAAEFIAKEMDKVSSARLPTRVTAPVILSVGHVVFFAAALTAFWVLFAVGFYVILNDPYRIFERLADFGGRPLVILIFALVGWILAASSGGYGCRALRAGSTRTRIMLGLFLTMLLIPAALAALTYYVFPFGTDMSGLVMPAYCGVMATAAFAFLSEWRRW